MSEENAVYLPLEGCVSSIDHEKLIGELASREAELAEAKRGNLREKVELITLYPMVHSTACDSSVSECIEAVFNKDPSGVILDTEWEEWNDGGDCDLCVYILDAITDWLIEQGVT